MMTNEMITARITKLNQRIATTTSQKDDETYKFRAWLARNYSDAEPRTIQAHIETLESAKKMYDDRLRALYTELEILQSVIEG